MNHLTAFSLSCLFWALFAWAQFAYPASSQYMQTPEKYLTGSGGSERMTECRNHVIAVMQFPGAEEASADFEAWVAQGQGHATDEDYVAMVRQMIVDVFTKGPQEAFNGCMGDRT